MKKKSFFLQTFRFLRAFRFLQTFRLLPAFGYGIPAAAALVLAVLMFAGCDGAEKAIFSMEDDDIMLISYDYEWKTAVAEDTVFMTCAQQLVYSSGGTRHTLTPQARLKLWPAKDTILFNKTDSPVPALENETGDSSVSGTLPQRHHIERLFSFKDGQTISAEIEYESYALASGSDFSGTGKTALPYMKIDAPVFLSSRAEEIPGSDGCFRAEADFNAVWSVYGQEDTGTEKLTAAYVKKSTDAADELLRTEYGKGWEWNSASSFTLYVEKTETWSLSGTKRQKFQSPALSFAFEGKEDRTLEVANFDFKASAEMQTSRKDDISGNGWALKKGTVTQTISFSNGSDAFSDVFSYPAYEAGYALDGQTFGFDLTAVFNETHSLIPNGENSAKNTTEATVSLLGKSFGASVVTLLVKKGGSPDPNPDPDPEPDPNPDPVPGHGKIFDFAVTAVLDVDGLSHKGNITKKAVVIRFEEGYSFGVCAYEEAFPQEMTYVQSGYTGFNSAAQQRAGAAFRLARAVDAADGGIEWYAEDNSLIAGVDVLTCKILGWKNIVNKRYSSTVNGYKGSYSQDRYTLTLTAPDGTVRTYKSGSK